MIYMLKITIVMLRLVVSILRTDYYQYKASYYIDKKKYDKAGEYIELARKSIEASKTLDSKAHKLRDTIVHD